MKNKELLKSTLYEKRTSNVTNYFDQTHSDTYEFSLSEKDPIEVAGAMMAIAQSNPAVKPSFVFREHHRTVSAFVKNYIAEYWRGRMNIIASKKTSILPEKGGSVDHKVQDGTYGTFKNLYEHVANENKLNDLLEYQIGQNITRCTVLHYLISSGYFHLIKQVVKDGAKIEALDADDRNALTYFGQYIDSYLDLEGVKALKFLIGKFFQSL